MQGLQLRAAEAQRGEGTAAQPAEADRAWAAEVRRQLQSGWQGRGRGWKGAGQLAAAAWAAAAALALGQAQEQQEQVQELAASALLRVQVALEQQAFRCCRRCCCQKPHQNSLLQQQKQTQLRKPRASVPSAAPSC